MSWQETTCCVLFVRLLRDFRLSTRTVMSAALVPLASLAQIEKTPSREDGLTAELEDDLKAFGCKLIHQAGILLKQFSIVRTTPTFASF